MIRAAPEKIWTLLEDSTRLPEWASMVRRTSGKREALGAVRECEVEFDGRAGHVVERCAQYDYPRLIGWTMVKDSFGFSRMIADFGFDFLLEPHGQGATRVANTTYYTPTGLLGRLMSALVMRRKFSRLRTRLLSNLKRLAEEPGPRQ